MSSLPITIKPFGTHAVLVEWPNEVSEDILDSILEFDAFLTNECLEDNDWETIPAYNSLLIINRNITIEYDSFRKRILEWYDKVQKISSSQRYLWRLPVCYDMDFGIDLEEVSKKLGLTISEIIKLHTSNIYTVYGIGFLPGFMYLGGLPSTLEVPRKSQPRLKVNKGSVGLAGKQTGIYPQDSPGGWNIIGNCSVPIFDIRKENPCFVKVGDKIQFYAISKAEYDLRRIEVEVGIYELEKTKIDA